MAACTGMLLAGASASAQTVPDAARIGQVEKRLEQPVLPAQPEAPPEEGQAPAFHSAVPKGAQAMRFVLKDLRIEGSTVYTPAQLAPFYQRYLGQEVSVADIYAIADAVTQAYRDDGYVLAHAGVPVQEIDGGTAVIHVVEGYVAHVRFADDTWRRGVLAQMATRIEAMHPLHMPTLEHMLLNFNSDPSLSVTTVIEPLEGEQAAEGAVGMAIEVVRKRVGLSARVDNEGSRYLGPWQQTLEADLRDTLISYDTLRLRELTASPENELRYGSLTYVVPLDPFGTTATLDASQARSEPGYTLRDFDLRSDSQRFAFTLDHPWILTRDRRLDSSISIERKDLQTDTLDVLLNHDIITAARATVNGQYSDGWNGVNLASLTASQGIDALGARTSGSPDLSRAKGRSDFTKLETTASRLQALPLDFSLNASVSGQYAFTSLLSSEQCGYGGEAFGRAYDASEITGDSCLEGSLELRYAGWDIPLPPLTPHASPFVFYDIGKVWTRGGDPQSGASAGPGLTLALTEAVEAQVNAAFPLTRDIATPLHGDKTGPRYGFRLVAKY